VMPDVPAAALVSPSNVMHVGLLLEHAGVFRRARLQAEPDTGNWADYRFAGTFFTYAGGETGGVLLRRAVVSYRPEQRQYIVSEGDSVGGAEVVSIGPQELVLRRGGKEAALALGAASGGRVRASGQQGGAETRAAVAGAQTRFGEKTGDGTWTMNRESLMAYYEELLENPERLLQVFDSMQPIYTADGAIEGYQLHTVGEAAFFEAVGFREGDKVRSVNTLAMTNRRRAEFFIRQVVENDLSAIVIDIERDGAPQRLVYELR
jgi:type II secretory pathway component PulC